MRDASAAVTVSGAWATVNVRDTAAAAFQVPSPAWAAVTVQVPAPVIVTVLPATVHGPVAVKGAKLSPKQVMLLVTAANRDEAENLGEALLSRGLARRGSVIPVIHSFWMNEEKLERSHEAMLLVTTSSERAKEAVAYVRENHSFEEPQIVVLPMGDEPPA